MTQRKIHLIHSTEIGRQVRPKNLSRCGRSVPKEYLTTAPYFADCVVCLNYPEYVDRGVRPATSGEQSHPTPCDSKARVGGDPQSSI